MQLVHAAYEPQGSGPHPTIIALHGWGANALDLLGLAPHLCNGRWLVLCPQGTVSVPLGAMGNGWGWFPLTLGQPPDPIAFREAVAEVGGFIDEAQQRYPIHPRKRVLLGFSQGGVVAYALALAEPQRFAGLVALSSWLPAAVVEALLEADRSQLLTLVQHGSGDDLIAVSRARESLERLRALRVPVTYREYPMGHEISARSLHDLSDWLERNILSPILTL
jgi:phospholipase/carboxylesterase